MGDLQNLAAQEGVEKLKELVKDINICMFCTQVEALPFDTRPMATMDVDDEGNFWFFSQKGSNKNVEVKQNDIVQLIYAKPASSEFLSVTGSAHLVQDRSKIEELWTPMVKAWFTEGKDDPDLSVIKVVPQNAYYWDTKHGKMVSLIKIATAVVTGKSMDDGIEGSINL